MIALVTVFSTTTTTTYTDAYGSTYESVHGDIGPVGLIAMVLGYLVVFVVVIYMHAGLTTGCLDLADGRPVTIGTFFKPRNLGGVVLTALLLAIGVSIGSLLCVIPGIIFGFLAQFAITAAVDKSYSPVDSIKHSIQVVRGDIGGSLLSYLVQAAAVLVGELACFIGMLVGIPVATLIQIYTYRKLSGGQVAELNQGPPAGLPPGPQYA
jgi:uncharacterized membrane protein